MDVSIAIHRYHAVIKGQQQLMRTRENHTVSRPAKLWILARRHVAVVVANLREKKQCIMVRITQSLQMYEHTCALPTFVF